MTPGFAKTRAELPWLYYPRNDRVIINAHNFPSLGFDPSVNGKTPVAVWCPSRDDSGNGTTTLTDLVGSNNGTLTNMDAATDWVADTGAGGIRALDFDGSNDYINISAGILSGSVFSMSCWIKPSVLSGFRRLISCIDTGSGYGYSLGLSGNRLWMQNISNANIFQAATSGDLSTGVWYHAVFVQESTTSRKLYLDGNLVLTNTTTSASSISINNTRLSQTLNVQYFAGRGDDYRLWDTTALDASDIAVLYASGAGRGISA